MTKIVETAASVPINPREVKSQKETGVAWIKVDEVLRQRRLPPELIIVFKKRDMTYIDILRKAKSDQKLMDLVCIGLIRRSQKGGLMLYLKKSLGKTGENFFGKMDKSLGEEVEIRAKKREIVTECKGIDKISTKEDIGEVLEK